MILVAVAILVGVFFVATGRGGELAYEQADHAPLDLGPVSATDVALLRPPTGLWGYNMQATDEAMDQIAESIRERDVRIVALEQLVTDLSRDQAPMQPLSSPYAGARHRRPVGEARTEPDPVVEPEAFPAPPQIPATEPVRFPFEPPRPSGESSGPPPEQSHD